MRVVGLCARQPSNTARFANSLATVLLVDRQHWQLNTRWPVLKRGPSMLAFTACTDGNDRSPCTTSPGSHQWSLPRQHLPVLCRLRGMLAAAASAWSAAAIGSARQRTGINSRTRARASNVNYSATAVAAPVSVPVAVLHVSTNSPFCRGRHRQAVIVSVPVHCDALTLTAPP